MGSNNIPYFRTKEFLNINKDVCEKFKKVVQINENSKVAILTSSGTGAMEAAVINTFNESDKILIIVGGGLVKDLQKFVIYMVSNMMYLQ